MKKNLCILHGHVFVMKTITITIQKGAFLSTFKINAKTFSFECDDTNGDKFAFNLQEV